MLHLARGRLEARGVGEPILPSLTVALPLFRGAADESREELQDLWARLLAAAMDFRNCGIVDRSPVACRVPWCR